MFASQIYPLNTLIVIDRKLSIFSHHIIKSRKPLPTILNIKCSARQLLKNVSSSKTDSNVFVKAYSSGNRI